MLASGAWSAAGASRCSTAARSGCPAWSGLGRALDLILTGRVIDAAEARDMGVVNEIAPRPVERALELSEQIAAFPQDTMLSDREAAHAALGQQVEDGLALEARLGRERIGTALEGARRFASGE